MAEHANRLKEEKSPYLLQHAFNPVDWYPWSEEAFRRAQQENRPVFLSIGYSTCHWCHVMARESFENEQVARAMNDAFINIKVDREERPDLDNIYMTACQLMTGSGGWPLTIIMTPGRIPFFAGTYLPPAGRSGRIGLMELIPRIKDAWLNRYDEVMESAEKIHFVLQSMDNPQAGPEPGKDLLNRTFDALLKNFDEEFGGFGKAPKFPSPYNLLFLLRYRKRGKNEKALQMVEKTLSKIRQGGIFDQTGFGFHRYSTNREWLVPHFEKMLYDQALLAAAYCETYQATSNAFYADTAKEIFEYVSRDMTSEKGGFYSAEDADSDGEEGKFYVWSEEELRGLLSEDDAELIINVFNVKAEGNYRDEKSGKASGANIFHMNSSLPKIAQRLGMPLNELEQKISLARRTLFDYRKKRIRPHKDDKILTDWNGLMIASFAMGARLPGKNDYADRAKRAADFICNFMRDSSGRLFHMYRNKEACINGYLDDYAFFIHGLIELYETTLETKYLETALDLNRDTIDHFYDKKRGGFYFTPDDGETLIIRKREIFDNAVPSGNSLSLMNLLRLAAITERADLKELAARCMRAFSNKVQETPWACASFMSAIDLAAVTSHEEAGV